MEKLKKHWILDKIVTFWQDFSTIKIRKKKTENQRFNERDQGTNGGII